MKTILNNTYAVDGKIKSGDIICEKKYYIITEKGARALKKYTAYDLRKNGYKIYRKKRKLYEKEKQ